MDIKDDEEPHCTIQNLEDHSNGLILLSGSFDCFIGNLFFKNLTDEISLLFKKFNTIFKDNFYIEIQRHSDKGENLFENFC